MSRPWESLNVLRTCHRRPLALFSVSFSFLPKRGLRNPLSDRGAFQKFLLKDYVCRYHFDPLQKVQEVADLSLSSYWGRPPDYGQVTHSSEPQFFL